MCEDLKTAVAQELGTVDIRLELIARFEDILSGTYGTGCLITVTGTGADFADPWEVFTQLEGMLVGLGWTPDENYRADGPTGTGGGFRRDSGLILVMVEWVPSPDADCPPDQPIGACELAPEQRLYTITLSAAMQ